MLAVERDGAPVFLHTHINNSVARRLIETGQVPVLKRARIERAEVTVGRSRFDFLLRDGRGDIYVEVKSCTLFAHGVAMFPDAITERGRRHLLELAELARAGTRTAVLFVVHTPRVRWFMPDYHTDLAFSRTLLEVRHDVRILPMAVSWTRMLRPGRTARLLDIPWDYIEREAHDRGSYLLVLRLGEPRRIAFGAQPATLFAPGYYVYAGSAMANLGARLARHRRARKRMHWHIDYLRKHASVEHALPIRGSRRDECALARDLAGLLEPGPARFGSSDCACPTHLFRSIADPLTRPDFGALLLRYRMRAPV